MDQIRTPLLVVQGANDVRCTKAVSDSLVESLRARGVPVKYFVAGDEGHHFENPENLITMIHAIERHFGQYLGGRSSSEGSPAPSLAGVVAQEESKHHV